MILTDEAATMAAGRRLAAVLKGGDVITLTGDLSAGKTTLVRGLLAGLGHQGEVPSPTFAIVQPYEDLSPPVWHVDLYRLDDPGDLDELGLEEAADEGVLVVEWPDRAGPHSWPDALALSIDVADGGRRRLTAKVPAAWEGRWPLP
jgi:tRNA threonylcarbamoyladenosine biosynthesis protein TsaE